MRHSSSNPDRPEPGTEPIVESPRRLIAVSSTSIASGGSPRRTRSGRWWPRSNRRPAEQIRSPSRRSAAMISRSERTRSPPLSSWAPTCAVSCQWRTVGRERRAGRSSVRPQRRRPMRVAISRGPVPSSGGWEMIRRASRRRRSRSSVTDLPVLARIETAERGTTPKRPMNSRTSKSRSLIRSLTPSFLLRGIYRHDAIPPESAHSSAATSPIRPPTRRPQPTPSTRIAGGGGGSAAGGGLKPAPMRGGCGQPVR